MTDPYGDRFRLLIERRMFARDNLPGWKTAGPDTGIVHGPEEVWWSIDDRAPACADQIERTGRASGWDAVPVPTDTGMLHGPVTAEHRIVSDPFRGFGWDAVPDTRDVRPDYDVSDADATLDSWLDGHSRNAGCDG